MASRRSLRMQQKRRQEEEPEPPRRRSSQRLKSNRAVPFSYQRSMAYPASTTSAFMHSTTPRTVFRKVLQTQSIVSPLDSKKPASPKSIETGINVSSKARSSINLEVRLPDSTQRVTQFGLHSTRSKKVRLSAFERELNKQIHSSTGQSLLNRTSSTKSFQISLSTPAPPNSAGKTGLVRRPKNYQGVNVKDFEGDLEQDLLQAKVSAQNHLEEMQVTSLLPNDTGVHSAGTELFVQPPSIRKIDTRLPTVPTQPLLTSQSLANGSGSPFSWTPSARQEEKGSQREILAQGSQSTDGTGAALKGKASECLESLQDAKGMLSPGPRAEGDVDSVATQGRQKEHFHVQSPPGKCRRPKDSLIAGDLDVSPIASKNAGNSPMFLEAPPRQGIGPLKSSTPLKDALAEAHQSHVSNLLNQRKTRRSIDEMVTHFIRELDDIVFPAVAVTPVSQRPSVGSSKIHLSGKTPKHLERTPIQERTGGGTSRVHDGGKRKERLGTETEQVLMAEAENNPEVEEMSESNSDSENAEPTGNTPAFVHAKAFHCTPLLSTPYVPRKMASGRSPIKRTLVEEVPRKAKKACREKQNPAFPSSFIKNMFGHYAKMPVAKDAVKAVERCVSLYFKHLSSDLEAYTRHAGRKTAEPADLELLMRRQGLVTDRMPLNVLVERHLPLEYRKLLIPVATSGNKVIPNKL